MIGKNRWSDWGSSGYNLVVRSSNIFLTVDKFAKQGGAPLATSLVHIVPALTQQEAARLEYHAKWADTARGDHRSGGGYTFLSLASFVVQHSVKLLWASHILLTVSPSDEEAQEAAELARSLCENAMAQANGLRAHGGKMSHAEGDNYFSVHFSLVTTSPLFINTMERASVVGGMPSEWDGSFNK